ncbi:MAG: hypothetical protein ABEK12_01800 [Candidatus Nanohaloarchaea archaeon]
MKFKFLGRLRGDEGGEEAEGRGRAPIDEVQQLSQQGYSEDEITNILRDRGYAYGEINEAINQAVRDTTVQQSGGRQSGGQQAGGPADQPPGGQQPGEEARQGTGMGYEEQPPAPEPQPEPQPQPREAGDTDFGEPSGVSAEEEELIETIVAEHFTDVEDEFDNVYAEIDEMADELAALKERVDELETREDEDQQEFIQRMDSMQEYLEESQSRIGGMEKAMQQVLPSAG